MSYCTNCGSILPANANFCHVCGTKVEVQDIFATKNEPVLEQKEEPKPAPEPAPAYRSYYDDFRTLDKGEELPKPAPSVRRARIPGLIAMLGTLGLCIEAGAQYGIGMLTYNSSYDKGITSWKEYSEYVANLLSSVSAFLIMAALLGFILGGIGISVAAKAKNKKGIIFSVIGVVLGVAALAFAIIAIIVRGKMGV